MLLSLIKNELRKIFRRTKTWVVFGLFVIFTILMIVSSKISSDNMKYYNSLEYTITNMEQNINNQKEYMKNSIEGQKLETDDYLKESELTLEKYKQIQANTPKEEQWKEMLKIEKEGLENNINLYGEKQDDFTYEKERIKEIDEALKTGIEPNNDWEFEAVNFSTSLITIMGTLILAAGIAIFISDIVSGESTPATFKFLLVQPVKRGKVLLSKFIASIISVVGLIATSEIVSFLIIGIFTGFKNASKLVNVGIKYKWDYTNAEMYGGPQLVSIENSGKFISKMELLLSGFGMQILFIVACCAFVFMISTIFKSSMSTMALSVMITILFSIVTNMSSAIRKIAHLIFFSYGDTISLIEGNIAMQYQNINFSPVMGVGVMLVTIALCYGVSYIVFNKKDMLI